MRSWCELATEKKNKEEGKLTDYKARPSFMIKGYSVDYFGMFDHIVYDPKTGTLSFIQTKSATKVISKSKKEDIMKFEIKKVTKEVWTWKDKKTVKKEIFH